MYPRLHRLITPLLLLLPFNYTYAVETLSTDELVSHCKYFAAEPKGVDATFCIRYIQGFIDGAVATDERVTRNVAEEITKDESFSERAIRIRAPRQLERYGPTIYAEFCLGKPVSLLDVTNAIIDDLLNPGESAVKEGNARDAVYQSLRNNYPCKIIQQK